MERKLKIHWMLLYISFLTKIRVFSRHKTEKKKKIVYEYEEKAQK